jgi:ATP-dependent exoDNAse (exonuclease V) alpha subunit
MAKSRHTSLISLAVYAQPTFDELAAGHMRDAERYTTADVVAAERVILDAAAASSPDQKVARVTPAQAKLAAEVVEAGRGFALSVEQRRVLREVVTSGRAVEAVVGPAGCGKTTLMRATRVAWEAAGHTVAGAATQAVAAQALQAETGIAVRSVASWRWVGLAGIDVLVLDEASLTEDRDRAWLYSEAARTGTKLVEIGDPRQLRGVGLRQRVRPSARAGRRPGADREPPPARRGRALGAGRLAHRPVRRRAWAAGANAAGWWPPAG